MYHHKVTALSDTGAARNCIRKQVVKSLNLEIRRLRRDEPRSLILGNGKSVKVIGTVKCSWEFASDGERIDILLYVLADCIFDVILGSNFLHDTETITKKTYRLSPLERPRKFQLVSLCGMPVRCLKGRLDSTECFAVPDSGAEPNLISYKYAEARGWLLDMFPGPESCRMLQFADGSMETVSGRLRLQWDFATGWNPGTPGGGAYYDFDVLRGCPFDVILGRNFLDDTGAVMNHMDKSETGETSQSQNTIP